MAYALHITNLASNEGCREQKRDRERFGVGSCCRFLPEEIPRGVFFNSTKRGFGHASFYV